MNRHFSARTFVKFRTNCPFRAASDASEVAWIEVGRLPPLAFDHTEIVAMAHQRLTAKLNYSTIALQFMPENFTLSELQQVYESILGERLDKRNFRKRLMALDCIKDTGNSRLNGNHRPARLYTVKLPGTVEFTKSKTPGENTLNEHAQYQYRTQGLPLTAWTGAGNCC